MLQPFTDGKSVIQLVLPPAWVARLNQVAVERGVNRSALIRAALEREYFGGSGNKTQEGKEQAVEKSVC